MKARKDKTIIGLYDVNAKQINFLLSFHIEFQCPPWNFLSFPSYLGAETDHTNGQRAEVHFEVHNFKCSCQRVTSMFPCLLLLEMTVHSSLPKELIETLTFHQHFPAPLFSPHPVAQVTPSERDFHPHCRLFTHLRKFLIENAFKK